MPNLRESYAATELQSHAHSDLRETPIDRIAAAGLCNPQGVNLWKAKFNHDSRAFMALSAWLFYHCQSRYKGATPDTLRRAVQQSLKESLSSLLCLPCNGAGGLLIDQKWEICPKCEGTSVKRWSDLDRARSMQVSMKSAENMKHKIAYISRKISELDHEVNREMNRQLERN